MGLTGSLKVEDCVSGETASGGDDMKIAEDAVNNQLVVGRPADAKVTLLRLFYSPEIRYAGNGNGSVTKTPDQASYRFGDAVSLSAVPDSDSLFSGWSGAAGGITNPITLTVDAPLVITSTFTSKQSFNFVPMIEVGLP